MTEKNRQVVWSRSSLGRRRVVPIVAMLLSVAVSSCEVPVDPFMRDLEPPYHIVTGYLDATRDRQYVRVQPLRRTLEPEAPTLNEFSVTMTVVSRSLPDLMWRDSLVILDDGSRGHLFHADFRPEAGEMYRLTVRDDTGKRTDVSTTVPAEPDVLPSLSDPNATHVMKRVKIMGVAWRPPDLAVVYDVTNPQTLERKQLEFGYFPPGLTSGDGWSFDISLSSDRRRIDLAFGLLNEGTVLILHSMSLSFVLFSSDWAARACDDCREESELRSEIGFFGSVGEYRIEVPVELATRGALNYLP